MDTYTDYINWCNERLYPDIEYWCDTGTTAQVNLIVLEHMCREIENKRPFWKRKNK